MKDFKKFLLRGNVVDLAIAVVIGVAFGAVITSFVKDVLTPLMGLLNVPDFSARKVTVGGSDVMYGLFLNALISFVIVAAAIFFFVVKPMSRMMARSKSDADSPTRDCPHCMSAIPKTAKVCAFCTRDVKPAKKAPHPEAA